MLYVDYAFATAEN